MAKNEKSSKRLAAIAAKALRDPKSVSEAAVKALAASVLTQAGDKKKAEE